MNGHDADGHDAFGISKSFVPGKGYKAAKDLTSGERTLVRAKAQGKTIRLKLRSGGVKEVKATPNRAKNAPSAKGRAIWPGTKTKQGTLTKVVASRQQTGMHVGPSSRIEGFSQPDGRGGGRVVIHNDADFKTTSRHEMAHISPRRNPVRFQERSQNPTRLGREEGRADFTAHGTTTTGRYPGGDEFQRGYNEVQGKMAAAKWRKQRRS